jgi:hypothetical protein
VLRGGFSIIFFVRLDCGFGGGLGAEMVLNNTMAD